MLKGHIKTLAKRKTKTFKGWVIYSWDMVYSAYLFGPKPQRDSIGWQFEGAVEINPYLLRSLGVTEQFNTNNRDYYYGIGSDGRGNHNPIKIELTLPIVLLNYLGL